MKAPGFSRFLKKLAKMFKKLGSLLKLSINLLKYFKSSNLLNILQLAEII